MSFTQKKTAGKILRGFAIALVLLWIFPIRMSAQTNSQQIYLQCLTNFETYAETIWHPATYSGAPPDSGYWGDGGAQAGNNGGIRGNGGIAVAYAVLCLAYPNDPKYTNRLARVRQALNYNAATHFTGANVSVNGVQWGWGTGSLNTDCSTCNGCADWQSSEWAGSTGLAGLLVQSNLPASTVAAVQRVIASEATHRAGVVPCSLPLSTGDTKAEENAWDGNSLSLAAAWMSTNNSAPSWLNAAQSYLVNTYTVANTTGDPLSNWVSTVTLYPEFALVNHGFYHPTYEMVAGMSSGDSLLMARLADTNLAAQLLPFAEHNVQTVWNTNLSPMLLDSGDFAYPSGLDWELHDYEQDSYITWMAAHFNDPVARWADSQLAQLVRYRQIINGDGEFVGTSGGGFYREAVEARRTAIAWLQWANADFPNGPTSPPPPVVVYYPDVGVIAQRSAWGFTSVSFGSRIMSMVEAATASFPSNTFVATPALPGGFGNGSLGNAVSAALVNFTTNRAGFTAQLLLQNGANGQTRVYVNSCGESVAIVEVPLPAGGVTGTTAGCFTNGIENDPLTGGTRLVEWNGGSTLITNRTGVSTNINSQWVCVSGNYGLVTGPGGTFRYRAASGYNRLGAAQDYLHVVPQTRLGARYLVWFPAKTASQTAALAGQITWTTNTSSAVLAFPGNGVTNIITASLASGNGTWTADANGNWSDSANWANSAVADGTSFTADFSTVNITANRTVTLDESLEIGTLDFGDSSGSQNWFLNSTNGSVLTLSAAAPSIVVEQNTATINAPLAGVSGFTKSGAGTLVLAGNNSLSGALHLDTGSATASDGAVRITRNAALANITFMDIRNNSGSGAASTLQLDGTLENLNVTQTMTNGCRANAVANVENIAGSNIFSGNLYMQTGGSNIVFQSDSGTLVLNGTLQYVGTLTAGRMFNFNGAGDTLANGPILFSSVAPLSVGKSGTGALTLNGTNTYTGATTVNAGTLRGTGIIAGPVTVLPGAILSPGGNAIGTLTINNALTNFGTIAIRLNKSGATLTNDAIAGLSNFVLGGTLQIAASGDQITAGDSFKLFSTATHQFFFANILPSVPGTNLVWNTNNLAADGTLAVAFGNVKLRVTQFFLAGTNFVWSGGGGAAGYAYSILSSTNPALPLAEWSLAGTGVFDNHGNFNVTNHLSPEAQRFYELHIP